MHMWKQDFSFLSHDIDVVHVRTTFDDDLLYTTHIILVQKFILKW